MLLRCCVLAAALCAHALPSRGTDAEPVALVAPEQRFGGDHDALARAAMADTDLDQASLSTTVRTTLQSRPGESIAKALNERFNLQHIRTEDAVIIHQWDGWEHPEALWKQCPLPADCKGDMVWSVCNQGGGGEVAPRRERVSSTVIHAGLKRSGATAEAAASGDIKEETKWDVPLFSYEGGVVLRPSKNKVSCAYGVDAGTDYADAGGANTGSCHPAGKKGCVPGCGQPPQWCNAKEPMIEGGNNGCRCGFDWCSGRPRPWKPEDLGSLLDHQVKYGAWYGGVGSLDGYNEVRLPACDLPRPPARRRPKCTTGPHRGCVPYGWVKPNTFALAPRSLGRSSSTQTTGRSICRTASRHSST